MKNFVIAFHVCCETKEQAHQWRMSALQILDQNTHALGYKPDETGDLNCHCSGHADEENGEEEIPLIPAPVVSTAAPEPPKVCKHCGENENHLKHQYDPWSEAHQVNDHEFEPVAPESYKPAEGPEETCVHCHMPLNVCRNTKWESEIVNRTRVNYRQDEECKVIVAEFPRILTQGRTKEDAIESLKTIVRLTAHLFQTGEFPPEMKIKPPAATPVTVEALGNGQKSLKEAVIELQNHLEDVLVDASFEKIDPKIWNAVTQAYLATPKPIGDVEAVARKICDSARIITGPLVLPDDVYDDLAVCPSVETIIAILSPFFAPAGPEVVLSQGNASGCTAATTWAIGSTLTEATIRPIPQPPCSECATPSDKWYMEYQAAVARAVQAETECDRLQKQIAEIAEAASRLTTVAGIQESCVKHHSLIKLAILDSQTTFKNTIARKEAECAALRKERDDSEKAIAKALRFTPSEEEPEECAPWMVEAEPEPMGPFSLIEAITAMMEMFDREFSKADKRAEAAEAQLSTLRDALEAIRIALKEPAGGEYWTARKFLDDRGIYNGDLDDLRVLNKVAEAALAPSPEVAPKE